MKDMLLYLYAESPVHAGGADSAGPVDLPIQREAGTGYPVIWGQSLKGALRQAAADRGADRALVTELFGSEPAAPGQAGQATTAGLLSVGDAQLVAMPVPTLRRTFAWVTSHLALSRLARKYTYLDGQPALPELPDPGPEGGLAAANCWVDGSAQALGPFLVDLGDTADDRLADWAARLARDALADPFDQLADKLRTDLLAVGSDVMPELLRQCTEFVPRVQLGPDKTVQNGPFHSEYLPAETILASVLRLRPQAEARRELVEGWLEGSPLLRIGGDETLGKGLMWGRLCGESA